MKRILFGALAVATLAVPASAFDNTTCGTFLVGKWAMSMPDGSGGLAMTLADGGVITMDTTMGGKTETMEGTWSAKAGAPEHCTLTAIEKGQSEKPGDTIDVTVKAEDTITVGELGDFKRQ